MCFLSNELRETGEGACLETEGREKKLIFGPLRSEEIQMSRQALNIWIGDEERKRPVIRSSRCEFKEPRRNVLGL